MEGVGFEEEKSSCSKRAILALLSFSKRVLFPQPLGFLLDVVNGSPVQHRQSGNVQTYSDLVINGDGAEMGKVAIGVDGEIRDQDQQNSGNKRCKSLTIEEGLHRRRWRCRKRKYFQSI